MMEEDFRTLIVDAAGPIRIAWGVLPQGYTMPAIRLSVVSETTDYTFTEEVPLRTIRVQADIFAASYSAVVNVDRALTAGLSGYTGIAGDTEFSAIFLESRFDGDEEAGAGSAPIHRITRDFMVKYKET